METGRPQADAIVVLGAALRPDGTPGEPLLRRIRHGVELFKAGAAPRLILCGGDGRRSGTSEAAAMRVIALGAGVPAEAILLDERSTNTYENAVETGALLRAHGLRTVLLVSERFHLPRARMLFRLNGVSVAAVSAAPSGGLRYRADMIVREIVKTLLSLSLTLVRRRASLRR
jgi:uncharacterized SAM-binding protein YcdF (DUF218 family)